MKRGKDILKASIVVALLIVSIITNFEIWRLHSSGDTNAFHSVVACINCVFELISVFALSAALFSDTLGRKLEDVAFKDDE